MSTTISYAIVDGSNKLINLSDYCVNTNVFSKSAFYVDGDSRPVFNPSIYFEGTDTMMVSDLPSECDLSARGKGRGITELHREDEPVYVLTRVDYIHLNEVFKACRKMEEARAEYVRLLGYMVLCQDLVQHKMRNFNYFQLTNSDSLATLAL